VLEYVLILEENKRQKLELAKKMSKKRRFQKRKTIKDILSLNQNINKMSKRVKTDIRSNKLDMTSKHKSPQHKPYKNNSYLDRTANIINENSLKFDDSRLPNLSTNETKHSKCIKDRGDRSLSSKTNIIGRIDQNTDYWNIDKENKDITTMMLDDNIDHIGKAERQSVHTLKRKMMS
jgi:hypothetical protein